MKELSIEMIYAKSPQAKGRVESYRRTLQDQLIMALRRKAILSIGEANKYLRKIFIDEVNDKFSVNGVSPQVNRSTDGNQLEKIFCYKTRQQVCNDHTIHLNGG
jgi:hypothetical protein